MAKRAQIERGRQVAGVFVPISRGDLSEPLRDQDWRKDLLMSWLFQTCIRLQTSLDRRFLRFGMTPQEASLLLRCVEAGRIAPGQLAVALGRDKGKITRFIDRLQASKLVKRQVNASDRRYSIITPTPNGRRLAERLASTFEQIQRELLVDISDCHIQELGRTLSQLHQNAVRIGRNPN
jgi:DNA-binding MarR family transcriptional regulator